MELARESPIPWGLEGFRAQVRALHPGRFIEQYLQPLFFQKTRAATKKCQHRESAALQVHYQGFSR